MTEELTILLLMMMMMWQVSLGFTYVNEYYSIDPPCDCVIDLAIVSSSPYPSIQVTLIVVVVAPHSGHAERDEGLIVGQSLIKQYWTIHNDDTISRQKVVAGHE